MKINQYHCYTTSRPSSVHCMCNISVTMLKLTTKNSSELRIKELLTR